VLVHQVAGRKRWHICVPKLLASKYTDYLATLGMAYEDLDVATKAILYEMQRGNPSTTDYSHHLPVNLTLPGYSVRW
jgi:hypothetical protein